MHRSVRPPQRRSKKSASKPDELDSFEREHKPTKIDWKNIDWEEIVTPTTRLLLAVGTLMVAVYIAGWLSFPFLKALNELTNLIACFVASVPIWIAIVRGAVKLVKYLAKLDK